MVMTEIETGATALGLRIAAIEEAYEFMLAYAAQGRDDEQGGPTPGIRTFLERIDAALDGIVEAALAGAQTEATEFDALVEILAEDARKVRMLLRFVLARDNIGSQLVDNLNASIHLRTLLTDLFLIDESIALS